MISAKGPEDNVRAAFAVSDRESGGPDLVAVAQVDRGPWKGISAVGGVYITASGFVGRVSSAPNP